MAHLGYSYAVRPGRQAQMSAALRRWRHARELTSVARLLPYMLAPLVLQSDPYREPTTWRVLGTGWSDTDSAIFAVGGDGQAPSAYIKVAGTPSAAGGLARQCAVLAELAADERLGDFRGLVPQVLTDGMIDGYSYVVEQAMPGTKMVLEPGDLSRSAPACTAALATIARFHRCTARKKRIDTQLLQLWVEQPVDWLRQLLDSHAPALDRLELELRSTFVGRLVDVSWIHGDFWSGNVLLGPDGSVTGIVDWDLAAPDELPVHDLLQLVISGARRPPSGELGGVVRARLSAAGWTDVERRLLEQMDGSLWNPFDARRGALLLYWLRFVTTYLTKQPAAATSAWWMAENVRAVLEAL